VVRGAEVVDAISKVPTGPGDRPRTDVVLQEVVVERRQA
jgi:peptidyl-prolyl cis-trans isomerase A (cyclophilin A)